ncbi:hypothetical protein BH09CHL1_BH09CHL1_15380 [soil metagenome]
MPSVSFRSTNVVFRTGVSQNEAPITNETEGIKPSATSE